jgi:hypothetical protein
MTDNKKGATPCESAPRNDANNSTVEHSRETERERGEYLPLAWAELGREAKAKPFRGKGKRKSRAAAISAKRHQGGIGLFDAVAWVAFGAWLATVALWLLEVLP